MDPFEKVVRQLLDNLDARYVEAKAQQDKRRKEIVFDIIKDLQRISNAVLMEEK